MLGTVPPTRLDQFNLRHCAVVIGIFGVITIISYFNELAKAGLLGKGNVYKYPNHLYRHVDASDPALLRNLVQKRDEDDNLDSGVENLKNILRNNTTRKDRSTDDVLSLSLHLGKDDAYETSNSTKVNIFKHQNTMPNYFLSLAAINASVCIRNCERHVTDVELEKNSSSCFNQSLTSNVKSGSQNSSSQNQTDGAIESVAIDGALNVTSEGLIDLKDYIAHRRRFVNATKVFLYQHELAGYAVRDCFKVKAAEAGLEMLTSPINQNYRSEWEMLPSSKKNRYEAMYGGLSFGVCETLDKPCLYFTTMVHPLDRILQVYFYCRESDVNSLCTFSRNNHTGTDMYTFIKNSGNTYFKKLLYYSKHCKLLGRDQVCIQDSKTSFILSTAERKTLLSDILTNLDQWFAVVGLVDHYKDSLKLFEHVLGVDLTKCDTFNHTAISKYLPLGSNKSFINESRKLHKSIKSLREKLLKEPKVVQWLYADLKIYKKMQEIYAKQWDTYQKLKRQNLTGKHLLRTTTKTFSKQDVKTPKVTQIKNTTHSNVSKKLRGRTTYRLKDRIKAKKKALKQKHHVQKKDQSQHSSKIDLNEKSLTKTLPMRNVQYFEQANGVLGYDFADYPTNDVPPGRHKQTARDYANYGVLSRDNEQQFSESDFRDVFGFDLENELQFSPKFKLKKHRRVFKEAAFDDENFQYQKYADDYGAKNSEREMFIYD